MTEWLDAAGRCFNPDAKVTVLALGAGQSCVVVDEVLANPEGLVAWAIAQHFVKPQGHAYPGIVLPAPQSLLERVGEHFNQMVRRHLGARRLLTLSARLSLVTIPPEELAPVQWQCHRDGIFDANSPLLVAASVLYLFRNPALGGTSFYVARNSAEQADRMTADSLRMKPIDFSARYDVKPGYMSGSNAYFERVAQVPAAWNRAIFYDGMMFHSGDIDAPELLSADPAQGRLSLNGFFTCKRNAG